MRIGVNTLFLVPGDVGGTEVYLRKNLEEMVAQSQDHTFVLFTTKDNDAVLRSDLGNFGNVEYRLVPVWAGIRPLRIAAEQILLPLKAKVAKLDVLWSPGYTAPFFSSCPQLVTIHDLQYLSFPEDMQWLERWTLDVLVRSACRRCCRIITISKFSKEEIIRHRFACAEKIRIVHEGVDSVFGGKAPVSSVREAKEAVSANVPYILCVAHTYPHKKVHLLVEAFGLIEDQIPHHLVLVGKARRGEDEVVRGLAKVKDQSRVKRYTHLDFPVLVETFQRADLFVLPSVYEGFGLPVLEAMMAGVPVVTTASASLPEVGGDWVTYASPVSGPGIAAAILDFLAQSPDRRQAIGRNGRIWAEKFSWRTSASETMKTLLAACATAE
ncbi:MAG: glycosyltransferase family 4 protein [Desulfobulbaceae bacterium]|nr:glycosyltransferase family 4 protein [Desulfobulbaceae bacterium]